jgi:hypothetical protein
LGKKKSRAVIAPMARILKVHGQPIQMRFTSQYLESAKSDGLQGKQEALAMAKIHPSKNLELWAEKLAKTQKSVTALNRCGHNSSVCLWGQVLW